MPTRDELIEFFVNIDGLKVLITERLKEIIQDLVEICLDQKSFLTQKLTNLPADAPESPEASEPARAPNEGRSPSGGGSLSRRSAKRAKGGNLSKLKVT
ncbi:MAG: hypothetical protein AAF368_02810 [Planctomycetota bacterium]